jgi:hypothetical protein
MFPALFFLFCEKRLLPAVIAAKGALLLDELLTQRLYIESLEVIKEVS